MSNPRPPAVLLWRVHSADSVVGPVDLSLAFGTLTIIVGPNGSGKSRLLRLISGAEQPRRGSVQVADVPVLHAFDAPVDVADRRSSGKRRRDELRAAIGTPAQIQLFDSPTTHLDTTGRDDCIEQLHGLADRGVCVIATTLDPEMVALTRSDIYRMEDGRLVPYSFLDPH